MENKSYILFVPDSHSNCTLDNFDWRGKEKLLPLVNSIVRKERQKGLVLIGDPGVGKTHLLIGIFRKLLDKGLVLGSEILFMEFQKFVQDMIDNMKNGLLPEKVIEDLQTAVLIVDDVRPCWSGRLWCDILKKLIEKNYENGSMILLSTNANSIDGLIKMWNLEDYWLSRLYSITDIVLVRGEDRRVK